MSNGGCRMDAERLFPKRWRLRRQPSPVRRGIKKPLPRRRAEEATSLTDRESLPLIFPRAFPGRLQRREARQELAPFPFGGYVPTERGGCQGFKGPAPSTLLDELSETSFHEPSNRRYPARFPDPRKNFLRGIKTREPEAVSRRRRWSKRTGNPNSP